MITIRTTVQRWAAWSSRAAILLGFAVSVTLLLIALAGRFEPKVLMSAERASATAETPSSLVAQVRLVRQPRIETAVGTIRPVHETTIGARLLARVLEANLKAGQVVDAGEVLVRLDAQ